MAQQELQVHADDIGWVRVSVSTRIVIHACIRILRVAVQQHGNFHFA
jgi:hypothetical protein